MSYDVIDTEHDISLFQQHIDRVKKDPHRLTECEWMLLEMAEHMLGIIEALDERTRSHRLQLKRLGSDTEP